MGPSCRWSDGRSFTQISSEGIHGVPGDGWTIRSDTCGGQWSSAGLDFPRLSMCEQLWSRLIAAGNECVNGLTLQWRLLLLRPILAGIPRGHRHFHTADNAKYRARAHTAAFTRLVLAMLHPSSTHLARRPPFSHPPRHSCPSLPINPTK